MSDTMLSVADVDGFLERVVGHLARAADPAAGRVYFVQAVRGGPVKIGHARDVAARLRRLQTASPYQLRVLVSIPGTLADEARLHARFAHHRMSGEWFRPAAELLQFVEESR